uniref:Uncharacterized protein n=1 Tax=Ciona intestinalis TaxID=7719 RepID=H2XKV1_CIOIN
MLRIVPLILSSFSLVEVSMLTCLSIK